MTEYYIEGTIYIDNEETGLVDKPIDASELDFTAEIDESDYEIFEDCFNPASDYGHYQKSTGKYNKEYIEDDVIEQFKEYLNSKFENWDYDKIEVVEL